ncbi:hypothetical protein ISCGN_001421 [Ixodes scapularis]
MHCGSGGIVKLAGVPWLLTTLTIATYLSSRGHNIGRLLAIASSKLKWVRSRELSPPSAASPDSECHKAMHRDGSGDEKGGKQTVTKNDLDKILHRLGDLQQARLNDRTTLEKMVQQASMKKFTQAELLGRQTFSVLEQKGRGDQLLFEKYQEQSERSNVLERKMLVVQKELGEVKKKLASEETKRLKLEKTLARLSNRRTEGQQGRCEPAAKTTVDETSANPLRPVTRSMTKKLPQTT